MLGKKCPLLKSLPCMLSIHKSLQADMMYILAFNQNVDSKSLDQAACLHFQNGSCLLTK